MCCIFYGFCPCLKLTFCAIKYSMDISAACIMVYSIIMDDSKLHLYIVHLACGYISGLLVVMLELWKINAVPVWRSSVKPVI